MGTNEAAWLTTIARAVDSNSPPASPHDGSNYVQAERGVGEAFAAFQQVWGARGQPPAITVAFVAGVANPQFVVEVSAVAVVPQEA